VSKSKGNAERRKHKRLRAQDGTLAVLGRPRVTVGQIIDMSLGGLAFRYFAEEMLSEAPCKMDILLADGLSHLYGIPCETVYDIESTAIPLTAMVERRRGVKFGDLTPSQRLHLEDFIHNHTHDDLEEVPSNAFVTNL
jgi:hypothetical protein